MDREPQWLWKYFEELCRIPRGSGNEAGVRDYIRAFAAAHGFAYREDDNANPNCVVSVPGRGACADAPAVAIQAHMDMVCVKAEESTHDFTRDPIQMREVLWPDKEGAKRVLMAAGTTLGADNGIGLVAGLAVATDPAVTDCPPLELLFTVEEETGLTGARTLDASLLQTDLLINLDTEELGEICISCAGGRDMTADWSVTRTAPASEETPLKLSLSGLPGGHSGVQIHEKRGNAIVMLLEELARLETLRGALKLAAIAGGTARNVIPSQAEITLWVSEAQAQALKAAFQDPAMLTRIKAQILPDEEDKIVVGIESLPRDAVFSPLSTAQTEAILKAVAAVPNGVQQWSEMVPGLVETSNNVAVISTTEDTIHLQCSARSSREGAIEAFQEAAQKSLEASGAKVAIGDGYPGWPADPDNPLLRQARQTFESVLGYAPKVMAVHAGLECGVFKGKRPSLQMISFGPDIFGAHTINERVVLESVPPFYGCLTALLRERLA